MSSLFQVNDDSISMNKLYNGQQSLPREFELKESRPSSDTRNGRMNSKSKRINSPAKSSVSSRCRMFLKKTEVPVQAV